MRILLIGDYSNVHATLARGLRELGHEVTVASDGDGWKNYPRDIDLKRDLSRGRLADVGYFLRLLAKFRHFRGYDVVQLINPVFLPLKAEQHALFYRFLRRNNRSVFMGAFGMDHYWVKTALDCTTFRYSDFNMGCEVRESEENDVWMRDWLRGRKGEWNRQVAADCDGIVAGLYEYYASYQTDWAKKLTYIPFPIVPVKEERSKAASGKVRFFIGIQRERSAYKGTDIMLRALERVAREWPDHCEVVKVESVPFEEYVALMNGSDVILDQLYSYTPAMNALEAMARGLIVVGGGEPENYEILNEQELRPIVNVQPCEADVYEKLRDLVMHPERIPTLRKQSIDYIARHHDYRKVARQYVDWWQSKMPKYKA